MNAAQQKCRAALRMVNMQRSVAVLPYLRSLIGLFAQKGGDFDFVVKLIAK
jgi:hypothetical protein